MLNLVFPGVFPKVWIEINREGDQDSVPLRSSRSFKQKNRTKEFIQE